MSQKQTQSDTKINEELSTKEPSLYTVYLLNDDFTTQDFVVKVLIQYFQKSESDALKIMLKVHNDGKGAAGVYTREIAETKIYLVHQAAKENNFPLKCTMEPNNV